MGWLREEDSDRGEAARKALRMGDMIDKMFMDSADDSLKLLKSTKENRMAFTSENPNYIGIAVALEKAFESMAIADKKAKGTKDEIDAQRTLLIAMFAKRLIENADRIKEF